MLAGMFIPLSGEIGCVPRFGIPTDHPNQHQINKV